ncbi:hypothetical protein DICPUDRAFT_158316 [Dictyostelium purpureum]|uniref:Uncharacterized protein n=1 Tax=Dictyostelium purpureum TaxID=5786 RepID=F1A1B0_DICPU|nr:uncharacterized protein DICPUDRAFT_158316 [Dictyostelium purpureum]EGC30027.1 hypothetical protein DICPUDRAFT_158316 [Dictyostelium purpureum]|eukprot:XP_003293454.1 hypothetical protein DICPUDRAFT_158316 [Dictyostelium purpureum]
MNNNNNHTQYVENKRVVVSNQNNKRSPLSSNTPKKPTFQDAVVAKSDVGEFQGGYFIMPSSDEKMKRPVAQSKYSPQRKKLPPVNQLTGDDNIDMKTLKQQQQQQYLQIKNRHQQYHQQLQQQQENFSQHQKQNNDILLTPASIKETTLNNDHHNNNTTPKKQHYQNKIVSPQPKQSYGSSPPRTNSPTKKTVSSPQSNWAGGAFNNSPAPNSLPIPNFDDDFFSNTEIVTPQPQQPINLLEMSSDLRKLLNITPTITVANSSY